MMKDDATCVIEVTKAIMEICTKLHFAPLDRNKENHEIA